MPRCFGTLLRSRRVASEPVLDSEALRDVIGPGYVIFRPLLSWFIAVGWRLYRLTGGACLDLLTQVA